VVEAATKRVKMVEKTIRRASVSSGTTSEYPICMGKSGGAIISYKRIACSKFSPTGRNRGVICKRSGLKAFVGTSGICFGVGIAKKSCSERHRVI
jgi:hypothetical protein